MTHAHEHQHGFTGAPGEKSLIERFTQEHWDERYAGSESLWSGDPNPTLVSEVGGLEPGTAVEVGSGEGADAIWLARRGWSVLATDVSAVALDRAAGHAAAAGADIVSRITWERRDMLEWQPPRRAFDLVTAHYVHVPPDIRAALYGRLAAAVGPGGTLLIVGHHPSDLETSVHRPPFPELLFTGDDLATDLGLAGAGDDAWEIVTNAAVPRQVRDANGLPATIHDTVFRARRRA
jgi:hypothetical protein